MKYILPASIFVTRPTSTAQNARRFYKKRLAPENLKSYFLVELSLRVSQRILIQREKSSWSMVPLRCLFFVHANKTDAGVLVLERGRNQKQNKNHSPFPLRGVRCQGVTAPPPPPGSLRWMEYPYSPSRARQILQIHRETRKQPHECPERLRSGLYK